MDVTHEKTLIRTVVEPDARHVKWINPNVARGVPRDVAITAAESGGIWLNDRETGEFLWAMPFPYDTPHFTISHIDVETGVAHLNHDVLLTEPGQTKLICYWNTRSFWPTAYSPKSNSLYVPYIDHCLSMTRAVPGGDGERRTSGLRPGAVAEKLAGIAKIDMRTGEIRRIYEARTAGNGAMLATAGDLLFCGRHRPGAARFRRADRQGPLGVASRSARPCRRARSPMPSTASSTSPSSMPNRCSGHRGWPRPPEPRYPRTGRTRSTCSRCRARIVGRV